MNKTGLFKVDSIRKKFIFILSLIIIIIVMLYSAINIYISDAANQKDLQAHADYIVDITALTLAVPLWNYDGDAIRGVGKAILIDEDVVYINIFEFHHGISVYESNNRPSNDTTFFVKREVKHRNTVLGHVTIGFDTTHLTEERQALTISGLIQMAILLFFMTIAIRIASGYITKPLEALTDVMTQFAEGNHDIRAQANTNDEVMFLAQEFNYMADKLKNQLSETAYRSSHDSLTGLYNRHHFEKEFQKYNDSNLRPFTIMIGDLNGLKMANDVYGHEFGDQLLIEFSNVLIKCCEGKGIPIRWGGDEFVILLPKTNYLKATILRKEIKLACEAINFNEAGFAHLSVAIGHNTRIKDHQGLMETLANAEDIMYREKLLESKNVHSSIMDYLKSTLSERTKETFEHTQRLWTYCQLMAEDLQLTTDDLRRLKLFTSLHDLGKIAISDAILLKDGPLDAEEWDAVRKHPEVGYRLALTSPELVSISELILTHHERWDGSGYPQSLFGDEIPLLSRILSIADAYDAMTTDRPYRKKMTKMAALGEIRSNSRKQFDPDLSQIFLKKISKIDLIEPT